MAAKKQEQTKQRMKLEDFFFADKHAAGSKMPILLPSGEDSGEWLQVMGPDCDVAVKAGREYTAAYRRLQDSLKELDEQCKAKDNWAEYNDKLGYGVEPLNVALAMELVTEWSFDEPFSKELLANLLAQYRGLAEAVAKHHTESRKVLSEK